MTRYGDYIVMTSMTLNACAGCAYAYQGHWPQVLYWSAAFCLNLSLLWMQ